VAERADDHAAPVRLVLATHNAHKVQELRRILGPALDGLELEAYDGPEPVEDGDTFESNALIKARAAAMHSGLPAIADDSGIGAVALGGAPGIRSARYAQPDEGSPRDDGDNLRLLLANLEGVSDRAASFSCAAALAVPDGHGGIAFEHVILAQWPGRVALEPAGIGGFGYDPIFLPDDADVSAAELPAELKDAISHRRQAFDALMPVVRERLLGS
jgi:XTP/dITP diphosphohydrolase